MAKRWFKALTRPVTPREIVAVDVEGCGGPGGFVCGSLEGESASHFFTDRADMWECICEYARRGFWVFAHNLEYDLPILAGDDFLLGEHIFLSGGLLKSSFPYKKKKITFYDSGNLFPRFRVEDLGEMLGYPKFILDRDTLSRLARGQAWTSFTQEERGLIEMYNRRDAEIVQKSVGLLQDTLLSLGGNLRPTLAGCSMDIYRRSFHKWPWPVVEQNTNELARPAFYGGRVEAFRVGEVEGVNMYDVTGLYPYIQKTARFPHPNHLKLALYPFIAGEWWQWEGVAQGVIDVPDSFIPILPARISERLFFPVGQMAGCWTIAEWRAALYAGCVPVRVDWVLGSDVTFNPFEDFIEHLYKQRVLYQEKGDQRAQVVKLLMNSLYGRFGLNPAHGLTRLAMVDDWEDLEENQGAETVEAGDFLMMLQPVQSRRQPAYVNLLFAAQIASEARALLNRELLAQGESAIYCDTDSIITRGQVETAPGLGGWRLQMQSGKADILGLKEYHLQSQAMGDRYIAKGVPEHAARAFLDHGFARFQRALGVREALRQHKNPAEWVETYRTRAEPFPKRRIIPVQDRPAPPFSLTEPYPVNWLTARLDPRRRDPASFAYPSSLGFQEGFSH